MTDERLPMMMLDIDGILTRYEATTADVLAAAQQLAVMTVTRIWKNRRRIMGTGSADTSESDGSGACPL